MISTTTPAAMAAWLEQAWLVRYLDRELSSEETAWFESYVLEKPDLLAMIDADTRLRDSLATGAPTLHGQDSLAGGDSEASAEDRIDTTHSALRPHAFEPKLRRRTIQPSWLALAATLVLGLGLGWIAVGSRTPALIASPTRLVYDTLRGEPTPPRVEHADSDSPYVLVEVAVPSGAQSISVTIGDAPEQLLKVSPEGYVSVLIERKILNTAAKANLRYFHEGQPTTRSIPFTDLTRGQR